MKVFNPSGWEIEAMANGTVYKIAPFSEKDIHWDQHAVHCCKSMAYKGLVPLLFNESMEKKHGTYESYKEAKRLEGLKVLRSWVNECYINERQAVSEIRERRGAEADKAQVNPDKFLEKLKLVDKWIKNEHEEVETPKLRGRPRKSEQRDDSHEVAAQA
jgi:hypothetical protein